MNIFIEGYGIKDEGPSRAALEAIETYLSQRVILAETID